MRIGYCCINKTLGNKGKFRTMTVAQAIKLDEVTRYNTLQQRTRENFSNLYDIMKWNVENNIHLYRVSSDLAPLYTHPVSDYDFTKDECIVNLCVKIKQMAIDNDIRLTIHPSQYNCLGTDKHHVLINTIANLEYEYKLCSLLGIEVMCLHVGSKVNGIEATKQRFIQNWKQVPKYLQDIICLENDDKSINVENTLDICETIGIPMILDFHHDRILPSDYQLQDIFKTWNYRHDQMNNTPVTHLSSSADETKLVNKHHDYISEEDYFKYIYGYVIFDFDVEFECKAKELAILKLKLNEVKK